MTEKRFKYKITDGFFDGDRLISIKEVVDLLNEQQATIEHLKKRLYDFEKRKIIEESDIDKDVIPKVKMLRTELFGEKYD